MENDSSNLLNDETKCNEFKLLLNNLKTNEEGLIINENFIKKIREYKRYMQPTFIKDPYLPITKWKYIKRIDIGIEEKDLFKECDVILFRETGRQSDACINLIKEEYKLNCLIKDLDIVIKFIGYTKSPRSIISIFTTKNFEILNTILEKKEKFIKKDLIRKLFDSISMFKDDKILICPNLSPNNILWIDENFCFTEIFLSSNSIDEIINCNLQPESIWCCSEIKGNNSKISFASNICCFGYLLYKIITNNNPFTDKH